jgi:hypothetical protein
LKQGERATFLS